MNAAHVVIRPDRIQVLGDDKASSFCLVTNTEYLDAFHIAESPKYAQTKVLAFDDGQCFEDLLRMEIAEDAHVLTILPNCLLHSVADKDLGRRKLLIMACRSGRTTDLRAIEHFLRAGEQTDPTEQEEFSQRFFTKGEVAPYLALVDREYETRARFNHLHDEYEWHEQLGVVEQGGQQVYPAGEIACFLVPLKIQELDRATRFDVDGRLALRGRLIVQSGPPSFLVEDQERIYERLATMENHAVLLDVEQGDVVRVEATHSHCRPAADVFEALFEVDSRFRRIYEFGFAFNRHAEPWPGNSAMNEVCGGDSGQLHIGLGMLPHTQYHIDLFLAGTEVLGRDDELIFGAGTPRQTGRMLRRRAAACPCMTSV